MQGSSVSELRSSAEQCTAADWARLKDMPSRDKRVERQLLRNPLKDVKFGPEVISVYGFYDGVTKNSLVYFWHQEMTSLKWSNKETDSDLNDCLVLGALLCTVNKENPSLNSVLSFSKSRLKTEIDNYENKFEDRDLFWLNFQNLKFAVLFNIKSGHPITGSKTGAKTAIDNRNLAQCLSFHFDYFTYRCPIWNAVPMRYFFETSDDTVNALRQIHLSPKCFDPYKDNPVGEFLWPWQKCINVKGGKPRNLTTETVSLVFDLRKSTVAMEQFEDLGHFSPFIEKVVEAAREIIFDYGGFFDKDTGDGIVAHFVDFDVFFDAEKYEAAHKRAFDAAVAIIRTVSKLCEEVQEDLTHRVESLGASVGLHEGKAVWLADWNNIRAIGESVVYAARLCSEAEVKNIFVTNRFFKTLSPLIGPEYTHQFSKRSYSGKEYQSSSGFTGFTVKIADMI